MKGGTQLRRNNPDTTNAALSWDLYLSEWFKDNFQNDLFIAQLTGSGKARCGHYFEQLYDRLFISMPPRSKLPQVLKTAGHFWVMLLWHHFWVTSVWAGIFLVQTISTTLSLLCDTVKKFFLGSQSYFPCHLSGVHYWQKKEFILTQSGSSIKQCR